jgi:hypothetical protein
MKIIPEKYRCEICGRDYDTPEKALECESKIIPVYPAGMIFGDHTPGAFYEGITFCIAEYATFKHINESGLWACRSEKFNGDTLGKNLCGNGNLHLSHCHGRLDRNHPTFKRMVSYLTEQNIPITVWNGEKPVPLDEWLKK